MVQSGADTNKGDVEGKTALHHAIAVFNKEMIEMILENRTTNIDAETEDGFTPLILAAKLSPVDSIEIIELLLNHGAKVSCKDKNGKANDGILLWTLKCTVPLSGRTALHWASVHDNAAGITLLVRKGADKDAQDDKDQTPLFLAAKEGNYEAVKRLLELGANKDMTDQLDRLPRDIGIERGHSAIVQLLDTPPALLTAAQLNPKTSFDCTGTLPHHLEGGRGPKPKPPKRTKSLRDTSSVGKPASEGPKKKASQKKQLHSEAMPVLGASMQQPLQMTAADIIAMNKQAAQVVPSVTIAQKPNPHPSIVMSPCYLDHSKSLQTPNMPYHPPSMDRLSQQQASSQQQQRPVPPPACSFSPPQNAATGGNSVNGSYACSSYATPVSGGGGAYYHRSPEAATAYIQSPPPYPQKCSDTALYNFASSCGQSQAPPTSASQQQRLMTTTTTPGYTPWPPQNTGDYVDYCSANAGYDYDSTTTFTGGHQQQQLPRTVEGTPMQESEVDLYYQHYQQMQQQQQQMWPQRDMYHT